MRIIQQKPNYSGAYPPIQEGNSRTVPPGMALWPDELATDEFYAYSGFVNLIVESIDGVSTVTAFGPNKRAWSEWEKMIAESEQNASRPEPTETDQLRADMDYIAAQLGVEL